MPPSRWINVKIINRRATKTDSSVIGIAKKRLPAGRSGSEFVGEIDSRRHGEDNCVTTDRRRFGYERFVLLIFITSDVL